MQVIIVFLLLSVPFSCILAAGSLSVVVNEIAWMGTEKSYSDEWIELYNNSVDTLNLEGWKLISGDGTPEINLEGEIPARGFFLLERTDDETVPDVVADLIYRGALENEGEYLKLIDSGGNIIDEIDCSTGWFAGDNTVKKTMERKNPLAKGSEAGNWQTSQNPGGTPKTENSLVSSQPLEEMPPEPEPQEKVEEKLEPVLYLSGIFINELLPSPEGADAENEWFEVFNENNFEVDVSGWQIRDIIGVTKTYTIPEGTKISAKAFLVLPRPTTKITLHNSGDTLKLIQPDGNIIDTVTYGKAPLNQSYNRTESGWAWSTTLTPGETNIIIIPEAPKTESSGGLIEKRDQTKPSQLSQVKGGGETLAKISEGFPKSSNPLVVFFIALVIAISSAIVVLFLKKRAESET